MEKLSDAVEPRLARSRSSIVRWEAGLLEGFEVFIFFFDGDRGLTVNNDSVRVSHDADSSG